MNVIDRNPEFEEMAAKAKAIAIGIARRKLRIMLKAQDGLVATLWKARFQLEADGRDTAFIHDALVELTALNKEAEAAW